MFVHMKEVIQTILSNKEFRHEDSIVSLISGSVSAGAPWAGEPEA